MRVVRGAGQWGPELDIKPIGTETSALPWLVFTGLLN